MPSPSASGASPANEAIGYPIEIAKTIVASTPTFILITPRCFAYSALGQNLGIVSSGTCAICGFYTQPGSLGDLPPHRGLSAPHPLALRDNARVSGSHSCFVAQIDLQSTCLSPSV